MSCLRLKKDTGGLAQDVKESLVSLEEKVQELKSSMEKSHPEEDILKVVTDVQSSVKELKPIVLDINSLLETQAKDISYLKGAVDALKK
jgi:archaellum component FlaC